MPRHHRRHERAADYFNQSLSSRFPDNMHNVVREPLPQNEALALREALHAL